MGGEPPAPEEPRIEEPLPALIEEGKTARQVFDEIMMEMAKLRRKGRNQAWAHLEERIMISSGFLIENGMMSFKEIASTLIEIEGFRKSEAGTNQLPGDYLAKWLSGDTEVPVGNS